jgi:hypothetical protein
MTNTATRSVVRGLVVSGLCILLAVFQVFYPYSYYSSGGTPSSSGFAVGVHYVYESDAIGQIYGEVARIHQVGFKVIRVNIHCDLANKNAYANNQTDEFFSAAQAFDVPVALVILNHESVERVRYYLGRWGRNLSYIQIMNEPELSQSWDLGTLFTDDEIITQFEEYYSVVESFQLPVKLYTNFEAGFLLRTNVPIILSKKLDFVGYDVYMQSFLTLSPNFVDLLKQVTGKEVIITELGMSTSDDAAQSSFLIDGLNLFRGMGLKACWLTYWNTVEHGYGFRGRLAEQRVGEWIAQNT